MWAWIASWFSTHHAHVIKDTYASVPDLQQALRTAGLESCQLIVAIDYTRSNLETGQRTFGGQSLHAMVGHCLNPYQSVIQLLGQTLEVFDDDRLIPAMGFGDSKTLDKRVFWFKRDGPCQGFEEVLSLYGSITPGLDFRGPTSFAPAIRAAMDIVRETRQFHLLIIVADGQITDAGETERAIVEASQWPMSILIVGVGDGPWDEMDRFDDDLPARKFDNLQFVNFHEMMTRYDGDPVAFTTHALAELPAQYKAIRDLGLLRA